MTSKPIVLIPTPIQGETRRSFAMGRNYVRSILDAGGVPLMAPVTLDERSLRELYEAAGGVMLAGGGDVDPATYGEPRHAKTDLVDPDRDRAEFLLTRWAAADDKPLFGICRGIQAMNVALGGTLVQDIPDQWPGAVRHNGHYEGAQRDAVLHSVRVEPGSRVEAMLAGADVGANSFHHQALKQVAGGLIVTSRAPDGVIEAVEWPGRRFVVGVQWHPEEMSAGRADMMALFSGFVRAASGDGWV
jgi:putative glutamine amidotransferase